MKTKIVRDLVPLIIVTVVLFVTGCGSLSPPPEAEKRPPIRIAYIYSAGDYPFLVAKAKGFFDQQKVDIELVALDDASQILPSFVAGKIDGFDYSGDGPPRLLAKNSKVRVVFFIGFCGSCDEIVARPEIRTIADLKGKKIGVQVGTFGELFVEGMLKTAGLTTADVQLVNADEKTVVSYLKDDTIQAGHTWEPYVTQAVKEDGAQRMFSSKQVPRLLPYAMTIRETVLAERPDDVRAFVRAYFQAVEYMKVKDPANAEDVSKIVGKALNASPDDILHDHDDFEFFSVEEAKKAFDSIKGPSLVSSVLKTHEDFLVGIGALGSRPDPEKIADSSFLP